MTQYISPTSSQTITSIWITGTSWSTVQCLTAPTFPSATTSLAAPGIIVATHAAATLLVATPPAVHIELKKRVEPPAPTLFIQSPVTAQDWHDPGWPSLIARFICSCASLTVSTSTSTATSTAPTSSTTITQTITVAPPAITRYDMHSENTPNILLIPVHSTITITRYTETTQTISQTMPASTYSQPAASIIPGRQRHSPFLDNEF